MSEQNDQERRFSPAGFYDHPTTPGWAAFWDGQNWDLERAFRKPPDPLAGRTWQGERARAKSRALQGIGLAVLIELVSISMTTSEDNPRGIVWTGGLLGCVLLLSAAQRHFRNSRKLGGPGLRRDETVAVVIAVAVVGLLSVSMVRAYSDIGPRVGKCVDRNADLVSCSNREAIYRITRMADTAAQCPRTYVYYERESGGSFVACVENNVGS